MNEAILKRLARSTATRYGLTLDAGALDQFVQRLPSINSRNFDRPALEEDAVEAALRVLMIEALQGATTKLDAAAIRDLFSRLCPLPPFC